MLKYVSAYIGFSSKPEEQSGNYLALKVTTVPADAIVTVELVGGTKGPVKLDSDMNIVIRITDADKQTLKVVATKGDKSVEEVYSLSDLMLLAETSHDDFILDLSQENDELVFIEADGKLYDIEKSVLDKDDFKDDELNFDIEN